jgi:hypothetical protein
VWCIIEDAPSPSTPLKKSEPQPVHAHVVTLPRVALGSAGLGGSTVHTISPAESVLNNLASGFFLLGFALNAQFVTFASYGRRVRPSVPSKVLLKWICSWPAPEVSVAPVGTLQPEIVGPVLAVCVCAIGDIALYSGIRFTSAIASLLPTGLFKRGWMPVDNGVAEWGLEWILVLE